MIWVSTYWGREGRGDGSVHTVGGRGEVIWVSTYWGREGRGDG